MEMSTSTPSDVEEEEDFDVQVEEKMKKMVSVRKKMFDNALSNIKDAQARYKNDYDKKRNQSEVSNQQVL